MKWGLQPPNGQKKVHHSRNGVRDKKQKETLHVNIHLLWPFSCSILHVINLLITEQINTTTNVWTDLTLPHLLKQQILK